MKKVFIVIFCFIFLSPILLPNLGLAAESSLTGVDQRPVLNRPNHSHHQHPSSCTNKIPCLKNHFCCNLITPGIVSYFFILDSNFVNPVETFFKPLEITISFYHPPQNHL